MATPHPSPELLSQIIATIHLIYFSTTHWTTDIDDEDDILPRFRQTHRWEVVNEVAIDNLEENNCWRVVKNHCTIIYSKGVANISKNTKIDKQGGMVLLVWMMVENNNSKKSVS